MNTPFLIDVRSFTTSGAVVGPLLLVLAVRAIMGGPAASPASIIAPANALPTVGSAPVTSLTPQERLAQEWSLAHRAVPPGVSPMARTAPPTPEAAPPQIPIQTPAPILPVPEKSPLDDLKLTTIMGHNESGFVAAMGKVYRFGDELVPNWKITSIDARTRIVEVTDAKGNVRSLSINP